MATTVYSKEETSHGITFRVKLTYEIASTTTTQKVVNVLECRLQYKGTYTSSGEIFGAQSLELLLTYGKSSDATWVNWIVVASDVEYELNATNFPSATNWTNKGSSLSGIIRFDRSSQQESKPIFGRADAGLLNIGAQVRVDIDVPAANSYPVIVKKNDGTSNTMYSFEKLEDRDLKLEYPYTVVAPEGFFPTRTGYVPKQSNYYYNPITEASPESWGNSDYYYYNTSQNNNGTEYRIARSTYSATPPKYTANQSLTLYTTWVSYIDYDGNGASLPSQTFKRQYKDEYKPITINTEIPTRSGYMFKEWNTAADGTGTAYSPGDTYSADVGHITLYAIWLTMPTNPQIGNMTAIRSNAQGQQDDTGTYASISADWSVDTTSEAYPQNTGTVTGTITPQSTGIEQSFTFSSGASGSSGTALALISGLSTDEQYLVKVTVTDQVTSTSKTVILTRAFFIMDFKAGGKGIGIGRAAPDEGLEIGYEAEFDDNVTMLEDLEVFGDETLRGDLHAHVTDQAAIANGDKLLFSDSSDNGKIVRSSTAFDGSSNDKVLSQKGTWEPTSATPTANTLARFDASKHMNSEDMTSQELSDFLSSLNLSGAGLETTQTDWIVEQGVDGIWTWRKWQSGIAECWGEVTKSDITWSIYSALSSTMYYSSSNKPSAVLPFNVIDPEPFANIYRRGSNVGWVANVGVENNAVTCTIVRNGNTGDVTVRFFVKGRWK